VFNLNPSIKLKKKILLGEKKKYFTYPSFQKLRFQQNFFFYKQIKTRNWSKLVSRTLLRYFQKSSIPKTFNFKFTLRKKSIITLVDYNNVSYSTLQTVLNLNCLKPFQNLHLFLNIKTFKLLPFSFENYYLLPYFFLNRISKLKTTKDQYLSTVHSLTIFNSTQLYKTTNTNFSLLQTNLVLSAEKIVS